LSSGNRRFHETLILRAGLSGRLVLPRSVNPVSWWIGLPGAPPHIYFELLDPDALGQPGPSLENADRQAEVYVGIPEIPESVFRGAVQRDGEPLSDILQEWLDFSSHPLRGEAQAA
jgi:hypothetical protein